MDRVPIPDEDPTDASRWRAALQQVVRLSGEEPARELLTTILAEGARLGLSLPGVTSTPYVNTIPERDQPPYPGDLNVERRIRHMVRWNAIATVVRANRLSGGIGGHISTYASLATLLEVGFHHFFRAHRPEAPGDWVYFQGHSAPGVYARAFLEGRLDEGHLVRFRRELAEGGGLSSYPHPRLMPDFWEFPTVSMGLSPICSIYQARFHRYLEARALRPATDGRVWAFLGDGEMDEPESMGAITLAAREHLDNLVWVVNCNLQRLDGPVRGNGKIIQELEAAFRGAGWNVIKVVWGGDWDPLLGRDVSGHLLERMGETVDGQYQKYVVSTGAEIRADFFGKSPELLALVADLTDAKLRRLNRGGHDPEKVYAAFRAATQHRGSPTVILAKTIKGYGLGATAEGRNVSHQTKKLKDSHLRDLRDRLGIPVSDRDLPELPFYRPPEDAEEVQYLRERRRVLGGDVPRRLVRAAPLPAVPHAPFEEFRAASDDREVATTQVFVALLRRLMSEPGLGRLIVPIVPDEARTFGMDALFRKFGIYSQTGQRYDPVDSEIVAFYREAKDGQLLEEGITEAGGMASFTAAGTAYASNGVNTIPVYILYSMFGFQRIGDLAWQHGDARGRGFLVGATAGRTTLAGEGLQHQDGQSHVLGSVIPSLRAYDPAYGYEIAVLVEDGIRRMYVDGEDVFYYLTVANEPYAHPAMPTDAEEGIRRGLYRVSPAPAPEGRPRVHLFGSGALLREALRAQQLLDERGVAASVWSATSYTELRRDAVEVERWNRLHPLEEARVPWVARALADEPFPIVAVTDHVKTLPSMITAWVPDGLHALGTDGFGRSEARAELRRFFEVDAPSIAATALYELGRREEIEMSHVQRAIEDLGLDTDRPDPARA